VHAVNQTKRNLILEFDIHDGHMRGLLSDQTLRVGPWLRLARLPHSDSLKCTPQRLGNVPTIFDNKDTQAAQTRCAIVERNLAVG
jgi:hypothetical protein